MAKLIQKLMKVKQQTAGKDTSMWKYEDTTVHGVKDLFDNWN